MRPLAALNAIVFGSATAITFGLAGVIVIFLVLQGRHPEMADEFPTLLRSGAAFSVLATISGASLFALLKGRAWRWLAQGTMWLAIAAVTFIYWPR